MNSPLRDHPISSHSFTTRSIPKKATIPEESSSVHRLMKRRKSGKVTFNKVSDTGLLKKSRNTKAREHRMYGLFGASRVVQNFPPPAAQPQIRRHSICYRRHLNARTTDTSTANIIFQLEQKRQIISHETRQGFSVAEADPPS